VSGLKFKTNFVELAEEYEAEIEEAVEAVDEAAEREAFRTMSLAKKITPVSPGGGRLRDSAEVKQIGLADYSIVYPVWYAIYVHERTELNHPRPPQARAKFLERALRVASWEFEDNVADHIDKKLG